MPPPVFWLIISALRTLADIGAGVLGALQSPQPPPAEAVLTPLINDIDAITGDIVLVLDDYHLIGPAVDDALAFFLEHLPPRLQLVIATREDPHGAPRALACPRS